MTPLKMQAVFNVKNKGLSRLDHRKWSTTYDLVLLLATANRIARIDRCTSKYFRYKVYGMRGNACHVIVKQCYTIHSPYNSPFPSITQLPNCRHLAQIEIGVLDKPTPANRLTSAISIDTPFSGVRGGIPI